MIPLTSVWKPNEVFLFPWTAGRATLPCVAAELEWDNRENTTLEVFTNQDEMFVVVRLCILLGYYTEL